MDFTDEDSGDEDTVNYENLTGNLLRPSIFTESEFYKVEQGSDKIKWTKQDLSKKNLRIFEKPISKDYSNMEPKNKIVSYCPIKSNRDVKKCKRGYSDYAMGTYDLTDLGLVKWNDNFIVSVLSTLYRKNPDTSVKGWDRVLGKKINIEIPYSIKKYNENM
ncbi:hypothetical protein A3Q56_06300 [Intoshia linei]|uniref:PiggyBac transposable element-derived protein domain-containing protein n=1 Tax=Intoshia linei TaxID=1819745 RepID=A0A177AVH2_9BILA|nr:hypothetical protein A3Q56_06300 [Intoshia linei]